MVVELVQELDAGRRGESEEERRCRRVDALQPKFLTLFMQFSVVRALWD